MKINIWLKPFLYREWNFDIGYEPDFTTQWWSQGLFDGTLLPDDEMGAANLSPDADMVPEGRWSKISGAPRGPKIWGFDWKKGGSLGFK